MPLYRLSLWAVVLTTTASMLLGQATVASAQTAPQGSTLTVVVGVSGVLHVNGRAVQPAPSGLVLGVGDHVSTIGQSVALVTFFEGTEVELGWDTTIILREVRSVGNEVHVTIEDTLGTAIGRIRGFVNPNSSYALQSPGGRVVLLVRGSHIPGTGTHPSACRILVHQNGDVEFEILYGHCDTIVNAPNPSDHEDGTEPKKEEKKDKDRDREYEQSGYRGPAPLTGAMLANRLTSGIDRLSATGSLLALGVLGWTFYGYLPGRRRKKDEGGDPPQS